MDETNNHPQHGIKTLPERYQIITKLESGGMADIYLGVQIGEQAFERLVVVKKIQTRGPNAKQVMGMFLDEARIVASLNHPHIVNIYDLSRVRSSICITMEYIDGENLLFITNSLKKREKRVPLAVACRLMIQACEALQYAHTAAAQDGTELNIIHRDIDPRNLMVDGNGYLKIIDFGVAKATTQTELTAPSMFKGKLSYIAPETFSKPDLDCRADIYALGLVFYQIITSVKPFPFKSDVNLGEVINKVCNEDIPTPSSLNEALPKEVDELIAKAINKDRDERFQSAVEFAGAIRAFATGAGIDISNSDEVKGWFASEFEKRILQRRKFEKKAMQKGKAIAAKIAASGRWTEPGRREITDTGTTEAASETMRSGQLMPGTSSRSFTSRPGAAPNNAYMTNSLTPLSSVTSLPPGMPSGSMPPSVPPGMGSGGFLPVQSGQISSSTKSQIMGSPSQTGHHARRVNLYVLFVFIFVLFAGGALLVHQLFVKEEKVETVKNTLETGETNEHNLFVISKPSYADVLIDGNIIGSSGNSGIKTMIKPEEMHTLEVRKKGYTPYEASIWGKRRGLHQIDAVLMKETVVAKANNIPSNEKGKEAEEVEEVEDKEKVHKKKERKEYSGRWGRKHVGGRGRSRVSGKKSSSAASDDEEKNFQKEASTKEQPPENHGYERVEKPADKPVERLAEKPEEKPPERTERSVAISAPPKETPKIKTLLSGHGNWSGAQVAVKGCRKCHGSGIDLQSKTEKQWEFFFRRNRHRRYVNWDNYFSDREVNRIFIYIINKIRKKEKLGIAGMK